MLFIGNFGVHRSLWFAKARAGHYNPPIHVEQRGDQFCGAVCGGVDNVLVLAAVGGDVPEQVGEGVELWISADVCRGRGLVDFVWSAVEGAAGDTYEWRDAGIAGSDCGVEGAV